MSNNVYSQLPIENYRKPSKKIEDLFWHRFSPRALSGEVLKEETILTVLEAARFAPSAFNEQPWRFIYSLQNDKAWQDIFNCLVDFNKSWAMKSAALIIILAKNNFSHNNKNNQTAQFDTGAAWQNLALQARALGLVAHGMSGFDYDKIKESFKISDDYTVIAIVALGLPGDINDLSEELREKEKPSNRHEVEKISSRDSFNF
jgi:nitroreductase